MCRLLALTSDDYMSPRLALNGLAAMREGYDGSGVGLLLRDLGGPFEKIKGVPILSGIFTSSGLKRLDRFMMDKGFTTKYKVTFHLPKTPPRGVPKRDIYLVRAYDWPDEWEDFSESDIKAQLMMTRLQLKQMGDENRDMFVFSFWPDTVLIKEIGDPVEVARYLGLENNGLKARIIMAQGRQNTNHHIDLYACHPFFLQGFSTMTNGENTAFLPNRDFLMSRGFPGYDGYMSDSEVFTHILHYTMSKLKLGLEAFKHVITPLADDSLQAHDNAALLRQLKYGCRNLIIDGPNCIIGCLPDNTLFMVQDRKKLRPGVVGGNGSTVALASEFCGLDAAIPSRDRGRDFQPMHLDTVVIRQSDLTVDVYQQTDPLPLIPT